MNAGDDMSSDVETEDDMSSDTETEDSLSDMEISDDDDDNAESMNFDDMILQMIKQPPSFSSMLEEFDISDACLVVFDGPKLKKKNDSRYNTLVDFCYDCRRKCNLECFSHPGEKVDGGLTSWEGKKLERYKVCHEMAKKAITIYNRLSKDGKLKLKKLIKVNFTIPVYFMTFSAINKSSGKTGIYQAALRSSVGGYVLGLFRDWYNDKILAVLSITGAEEDIAAKRKTLENCLAGARVRRAENLIKI